MCPSAYREVASPMRECSSHTLCMPFHYTRSLTIIDPGGGTLQKGAKFVIISVYYMVGSMLGSLHALCLLQQGDQIVVEGHTAHKEPSQDCNLELTSNPMIVFFFSTSYYGKFKTFTNIDRLV